jgi:hypothetical protein
MLKYSYNLSYHVIVFVVRSRRYRYVVASENVGRHQLTFKMTFRFRGTKPKDGYLIIISKLRPVFT